MAAIHCMVGIETLGIRPGSWILSIGAVMFDVETGEPELSSFYSNIGHDSLDKFLFTKDQSTLDWWYKPERKAAWEAMQKEQKDVDQVFRDFYRWYDKHKPEAVWAHGATFDPVLLEAGYRKCGMGVPWKYWQVRDTRTVYDFCGVTHDTSTGTYHNALDDARRQAAAVIQAYGVRKKWLAGVQTAPAAQPEPVEDEDIFG